MPFDGADATTRKRYSAYEESRYERTLAPQGERGVLFAPDLVGPSEQIVERLRADAAVQRVSELPWRSSGTSASTGRQRGNMPTQTLLFPLIRLL